MREGWLVVQRFLVQNREPAASFSNAMVQQLYRGMDGVAFPLEWPNLQDGLLPTHEEAASCFSRLPADRLDLVFLSFDSDGTRMRRFGKLVTGLLGYDFGTYLDEYSHFSSILNEVIYGCTELTGFNGSLNDSLLFGSAHVAREFGVARRRLQHMGANLETEESDYPFEPIAIYGSAMRMVGQGDSDE